MVAEVLIFGIRAAGLSRFPTISMLYRLSIKL